MGIHRAIQTTNRLFVTFLLIAWLSSCAENNEQIIPSDAGRFSAVTIANPDFKPQANQKFIWYSELQVADEYSTTKISQENRQFIQSSIEQQMKSKNFHFTNNSVEADYLLAAALILDNSEKSQRISDFVAAYPSLKASINNYEEGTLLVVITKFGDIRREKLLWRGAIKAYVVGEDLPSRMRENRLQTYIQNLMQSIPVGSAR